MGGGRSIISHEAVRLVPHPRTLRKARENMKWMVADGLSATKIRNYFSRWTRWWARTVISWNLKDLINLFISMCWDNAINHIASNTFAHYLTELNSWPLSCADAGLGA